MRLLLIVLLAGSLPLNLEAAEKPNTQKKANLTSLPGLTEELEAKLNATGINNVNDLLLEGATPRGRDELAARSGLPAPQILKFVHHADLFRIDGIAGETVRLLAGSGINTVAELARCNASNLQMKLQQVNNATKGKPPSEKQVEEWIEAAKTLPKVVTD
jgi:predicted flap endonuclease-1-like 5' DNA nuclease